MSNDDNKALSAEETAPLEAVTPAQPAQRDGVNGREAAHLPRPFGREETAASTESPTVDAAPTVDEVPAADAGATQVIDLPPDVDLDDPVVAKRIAHGLSPEPTDAKSGDLAKSGGGDASLDAGLGGDRAFSKERREQKEAEDRLKKQRHKKRMRTLRRVILLIVLLLVIAAVIVFWWLRWGTVDDKAAIQGTWKIAGSDATVTITDSQIKLTDEVVYDYVIDPEAKTIAYTFGGLSGQGRYRIALDGDSVAISDGEYDWFGTLVSDIPWTVEAFVAKLKDAPSKSPDLGTGQLLERVGSRAAADPALAGSAIIGSDPNAAAGAAGSADGASAASSAADAAVSAP